MLISIEEISAWTGLSTRVIRNYIRDGFLQGDMSSGKWLFTIDQYANFLQHPNIAPVIESKNRTFMNSIIDSVPETFSRLNIFLDLLEHRIEAFKFFGQYLYEKIDQLEEEVVLTMWPLKEVKGTRIIVKGPQDIVLEMLAKYKEEKKNWK